ncbi:MAG: hypothetical protein ACOX8X_01195 [Methanomethylophilus sp.]|jgi:hypothetical protein
MSAQFEEHDRIFSGLPYIFLVGVFAAAAAVIAICAAFDIGGVPWWMFWATAVITVLTAVIGYWLKVSIVVTDDDFASGIVRTTHVPLKDIIDIKTGDIDIMRNYSGWGIKKVRFKTFACPGIDTAVSVKCAGRLVVTVTTKQPDELKRILLDGRDAAEAREGKQ